MSHRGGWNEKMDVAYGPHSAAGDPNVVYRSDVDCRIIPQTQIFQQENPYSLTNAWITYPSPPLNFAHQVYLGEQKWSYDFAAADLVYFGYDPLTPFVVLRSEVVVPSTGGLYERALICRQDALPPLAPPSPPPPPPPPTPGGCGYQAVGGPVMLPLLTPVSPDTKAWSGIGTGGQWYLESYDLYPGYWALYKGGSPSGYDTVWANFTVWDGEGCGGDFERLSGGGLPNPQTVCDVPCPE
jgi:hypothetical protein